MPADTTVLKLDGRRYLLTADQVQGLRALGGGPVGTGNVSSATLHTIDRDVARELSEAGLARRSSVPDILGNPMFTLTPIGARALMLVTRGRKS